MNRKTSLYCLTFFSLAGLFVYGQQATGETRQTARPVALRTDRTDILPPAPTANPNQVLYTTKTGVATASLGFGLHIKNGILEVNQAVPTYLTWVGSLDFPALSQGACTEKVVPATGALPGDGVAAGWPPDLEPGVIGTMFVGTAGSVTIRLCKISTGTVDPPNRNYRATIVRSF